jgi:hypothetical protein
MRFFPKGLKSFKIQISLKLDFLLNFIIRILERFGCWTKRKVVPLYFISHLAKFDKFLRLGRTDFVFFKVEQFE